MDIMAVDDQVDPDLSEKVWTIVVRTCICICICICIVIIIVCFKSPLLIHIVHLLNLTPHFAQTHTHTHTHTRRTIHADGSSGICTIVRTRYESGTE